MRLSDIITESSDIQSNPLQNVGRTERTLLMQVANGAVYDTALVRGVAYTDTLNLVKKMASQGLLDLVGSSQYGKKFKIADNIAVGEIANDDMVNDFINASSHGARYAGKQVSRDSNKLVIALYHQFEGLSEAKIKDALHNTSFDSAYKLDSIVKQDDGSNIATLVVAR